MRRKGTQHSHPAYQPIEDYGVIGNLHTAALIARNGSLDWCCFPELPNPSVFGALLDYRRGGRFHIAPAAAARGEQEYVQDTNVLKTIFDTGDGRLVVTDFMPLRGTIDGRNDAYAPPEIHRIVACKAGAVDVAVEWSPRFDYARTNTTIFRSDHGFMARSDHGFMTLAGLPSGGEITSDAFGPRVTAHFRLRAGQRVALATRWMSNNTQLSLDTSLGLLEDTIDTWRGWVHKEEASGSRDWAGEWSDQVIRSELVLKLLTNADSGALAAAPTTSLPEDIAGVRNWDYRFAWIRDAGMMAQALMALGHQQEAVDFLQWAERVEEKAAGPHEDRLQAVYGLHGETDFDEEQLPHLEGYRRSSPVRIGNEATHQGQLDIYGETLTSAYELVRVGEEIEPDARSFLRYLADHATTSWRKPDYSVWEMANGPKHFTYSKAMIWAALDRARLLAERGVIKGNYKRWRRAQKKVMAYLLDRCYNRELDSFVIEPGSQALDAANLLIPMEEVLPFRDPHVQRTIDRTMERLMAGDDLVYRYRTDDGLPGNEGAFVFCSFWLVDALALSGRLDEARRIFESVARRSNHLGLYSEQIDPTSGAFLGNFPQAFSHIGFINSTLYLAHAAGKDTPVDALVGTREHRREAGRIA